jgi:hypothetical protein
MSVEHIADINYRLDGDVVVFIFGTNTPKKYTIHDNPVSSRPEFVRLAFSGEWKEVRERTIVLPDDEPRVFYVYQQWLYGRRIHTHHDNTTSCPDDEYKTLVKAYILGEKSMDQDFKDCIVDAITEKHCFMRHFDENLTNLVFENTPESSPFRQIWMDTYSHFGGNDWLDPKVIGGALMGRVLPPTDAASPQRCHA